MCVRAIPELRKPDYHLEPESWITQLISVVQTPLRAMGWYKTLQWGSLCDDVTWAGIKMIMRDDLYRRLVVYTM